MQATFPEYSLTPVTTFLRKTDLDELAMSKEELFRIHRQGMFVSYGIMGSMFAAIIGLGALLYQIHDGTEQIREVKEQLKVLVPQVATDHARLEDTRKDLDILQQRVDRLAGQKFSP